MFKNWNNRLFDSTLGIIVGYSDFQTMFNHAFFVLGVKSFQTF